MIFSFTSSRLFELPWDNAQIFFKTLQLVKNKTTENVFLSTAYVFLSTGDKVSRRLGHAKCCKIHHVKIADG
jgi:hypothetical protein